MQLPSCVRPEAMLQIGRRSRTTYLPKIGCYVTPLGHLQASQLKTLKKFFNNWNA